VQNGLKEIDPLHIQDNICRLIGSDWMLITAGNIGSYNTMTASWGGLGHLWDRNVSFCFIRPQRWTFNFVEKSEYYSFSFFDEKYRDVLNFCGSNTGRYVDKAEKTGISPVEGPFGTVYFKEARLVIINKKIYTHDMEREHILAPGVVDEYYPPDNDIHRMYIGEVVKCLGT